MNLFSFYLYLNIELLDMKCVHELWCGCVIKQGPGKLDG